MSNPLENDDYSARCRVAKTLENECKQRGHDHSEHRNGCPFARGAKMLRAKPALAKPYTGPEQRQWNYDADLADKLDAAAAKTAYLGHLGDAGDISKLLAHAAHYIRYWKERDHAGTEPTCPSCRFEEKT